MTNKKIIIIISLCLAGSMILTACKVSGSNVSETTDASNLVAESSALDTTKEPTETAAAPTAKATQKVTATPAPTVKETTAATTAKPSETKAPAVTTKATVTPAATTKATAATTKAPTATTAAPAATTAAPPVETAPPQTAAPAYAENCDNIKSLIIAQLQAKGLWYPDAEEAGGGSIQLSVGYGNSDEQYATAFVNGKFGQTTTIGATSVSVWIESGYLNMSYIKCALPSA